MRWKGNKAVTMASNRFEVEPLQKTSRLSKEEKKVIVNMQASVAVYNQTMGGVDLHDQFVANYRAGIGSKKWW